MTIQTHFIREPLLEFGHGQQLEHPQDGLFLYGPVKADGNPEVIHVGIVGTFDGISLVSRWLAEIIGRIPLEKVDQLHTSAWPGFQAAFCARLESTPLVTIPIAENEIYNAIRKANRTEAVRSAVQLFENAILEHLRTDDSRPSVWLCIVPEIVHRYGRPQVAGPKEPTPSTIISEREATPILRQGGSLFPQFTKEAEIYLFAKNFHHQLKAQLLHKEVVVQVLRETTLDPERELDRFGNPTRSVQEPARIAWNLSTTIYFKGARVQPWQLANVRPKVCYVGLVFKEDPSPAKKGEVCCAAQMFLNSGNGMVFRGALGPWLSPKDKQFHLAHEPARELIGEVIRAYVRDHGGPPAELFIHARQRFNDEEWSGFASAVPSETKLVGVRIRQTQDLRLFRPDTDMPVLRGTAVTMSKREGYLWSTGYVPRLRTYPGFETPKPLLVEINRGEDDLIKVSVTFLVSQRSITTHATLPAGSQ